MVISEILSVRDGGGAPEPPSRAPSASQPPVVPNTRPKPGHSLVHSGIPHKYINFFSTFYLVLYIKHK